MNAQFNNLDGSIRKSNFAETVRRFLKPTAILIGLSTGFFTRDEGPPVLPRYSLDAIFR